MTTEENIYKALESVIDPELGLPITDLGLIYDVTMQDKRADIKITLTSMGCPLAGVITEQCQQVALKVDGVEEAKIEIVWDPPWSVDMMSDEARMHLGML
jgi:metal-sulfur cluster biosynthetic enzyme